MGHVSLINTYQNWDNDSSTPITDDDYFKDNFNDSVHTDIIQSRSSNTFAGGITLKDVEKFKEIGVVDVNLLDQVLHFSPRYYKHEHISFKNIPNRKLYVALYKYNYGLGISIGLDCKVMKKMWYGGWAHVKYWDEGIYYGLSYLIVRQKVKDPIFDDFMKHNKEMLQNQWKDITKYNFSTYSDAVNYLKGGIENRWNPEYNTLGKINKYVIPIIPNATANLLGDISNGNEVAQKVDNFLVSKGVRFFYDFASNKESKQLKLFSEHDRYIYSFYSNDLKWNNGGYKLQDNFLNYYNAIVFGVTIKFGSSGVTLDYDEPSIKEDALIGAPEIIACKAIVYTKDGNGWVGAKIRKAMPGETTKTDIDRGTAIIPGGKSGGRR